MAGDVTPVQIVINVVDGNTGEVVSRVVKSFDTMEAAATKSSRKIADETKAAGEAVTRAAQTTEKGSAATSQNFRRTTAAHADMVGKIAAQQKGLTQVLSSMTSTGYGLNSFSTGTVVNGLKQVSNGVKEVGEHSLNAMDNVRLLRDDLGIRIPRAMEKVIATSKPAMAIIGAIGTGLIGLGSLELAFHVGREIYDVYDVLTDINKEVRKYQEGAAHAAAQHLFAAGDIETQLLNLQKINQEVAKLQTKQSNAAGHGFLGQWGQNMAAGATPLDYTGIGYLVRAGKTAYDVSQGNSERDSSLAQRLQERDATSEKAFVDKQSAEMQRLKARLSAQAQGLGQIPAATQEVASQKLIAGMNMQQTRDLNAYRQQQFDDSVADIKRTMGEQHKSRRDVQKEIEKLGVRPSVSPTAGLETYSDSSLAADEMGSAKRSAIARKENAEIERMHNDALSAGLQGEAQYTEQLKAQEAAITRRKLDGELSKQGAIRMTHELELRFSNERLLRLQKENEETAQLRAAAAGAGLSGLAKSDADQRARNLAIDKQHYSNPVTAQARKDIELTSTTASQQKEMDSFTERIQQMDEGRANSSMSANQRIDAETRRTVAEITKVWKDLYGDLGASDARRLQGQVALNTEITKINAAAAQQRYENTRSLTEQTLKLEDEAARAGMPHAQEQTRAVIDEYQERYRQLEELRTKDADNAALYHRQEVAAEQIKNGKLLDLARQQRDKLAGELRGYLSNPLEALKRQGEDIASKAAADLLMGNLPGRGPGASNKGGGLFDMAIFRPTFKRNGGVAGSGDTVHADTAITPSQAVVNASTAVIHVGSATFASAAAAAGSPPATMRAIAGGGYVSTGNGGAFNLGEAGSAANAEGAFTAHAPGAVGAPYIPSGPVGMGGDSPADTAKQIYCGAQTIYGQSNGVAQQLGVKGGLASKIPGLKNMSSESLGKLGGAASGALGVFSAFEGRGGIGGAASGALSGFQAGSQYGGLLGGAIGAIAGGVLGFIGHGARVQAQKYWFKELMPKAEQDMLGFGAGTVDYQSAYDDLTSMETEAKQRTKQMGSGAVGYFDDTIKPRIDGYLQRLTREQKAGRAGVGMSAQQFHQGGYIGGFGSMATSPTEGWVHAKRGEVMLNEQASMSHGDVAMMMNAGVSRSDIGDYLGGGGQARAAESEGGDTHLHVHTMDVRGVRDFLATYKHDIRGALNSSYAENSGGSD